MSILSLGYFNSTIRPCSSISYFHNILNFLKPYVKILLLNHNASGPFGDSQVDFAIKLASSIALALENSRLYQEIKEFAEEKKQMAYHDELTKIANRRFLRDRLRKDIARAERENELVAVLLVDSIARIGGDEFIVILTNPSDISGITRVLKNIHIKLSEPMLIGNNKLSVPVSIGISVYPGDSSDIDRLIACADKALTLQRKKLTTTNFSKILNDLKAHDISIYFAGASGRSSNCYCFNKAS